MLSMKPIAFLLVRGDAPSISLNGAIGAPNAQFPGPGVSES